MNMEDIPVLTEDGFLEIGMHESKVFGWNHCKKSTNIDRFKKFYCVSPLTCATMWNDLRDAEKIRKKDQPKHLLLALRFLFLYENETNLGQFFGIRSRNTVGKYVKMWVKRIQSLLKAKVRSLDRSAQLFKKKRISPPPTARLVPWMTMIAV